MNTSPKKNAAFPDHPIDDSLTIGATNQNANQQPENQALVQSDQDFSELGRILIAEDSTFDFRYLVSCLKNAGIKSSITWVEDGSELISFLEGKGSYEDRNLDDISLVLLDLKMPKMDGLAALEHIRNSPNKKIKNLPIVVLTTSTFEADLRQANELGITDYIIKPETKKETSLMIEDMQKIFRTIIENESR